MKPINLILKIIYIRITKYQYLNSLSTEKPGTLSKEIEKSFISFYKQHISLLAKHFPIWRLHKTKKLEYYFFNIF